MIDLPKDLSSKLNAGMETEGGIKLPFPAPIFWVINGDPKLKKANDAQFFGGWACKDEDLDNAMRELQLDLPAGIELTEMSTKDGKAYGAYITRQLCVAPIAVRKAWIVTRADGTETRKARYAEGEKSRQHVQVLCQLGVKNGEGYSPWSPIVLSAKGYQATFLLSAFEEWKKFTAELRRKIAPNIPPHLFYSFVGTFGERESKPVGKNAQSPITPIKVYLPTDLTEKKLESLFVGAETANDMAVYLDDAAEWLNAWKETGKTSQEPAGEEPPEVAPFDF